MMAVYIFKHETHFLIGNWIEIQLSDALGLKEDLWDKRLNWNQDSMIWKKKVIK